MTSYYIISYRERLFSKDFGCLLIGLLLTAYVHAQQAKQALIASAGSSAVINNYTFESTVGETIIATVGNGPICTQGLHQPNSLQVDFAIDNGFVKIFPNPVQTTAQIKLYVEERTMITFTLHNPAGQQVFIRSRELMPGYHTEYLHLTGFKSGIYVLTLKESTRGRKLNVKLLKL